MVRHQPLQYYEPQLCLSCLTGIYGCRWKRYQRSHDDTTPVSCAGGRPQRTGLCAGAGRRASALSSAAVAFWLVFSFRTVGLWKSPNPPE